MPGCAPEKTAPGGAFLRPKRRTPQSANETTPRAPMELL